MRALRPVVLRWLVAMLAAPAASLAQPPTFKSGVSVIPIDASVVDRAGNVISDLRPEDFRVTIDKQRRTVVTARWVAAGAVPSTVDGDAVFDDGSTTNQAPGTRRLIVFAVDRDSIRPSESATALAAGGAFIESLPAGDRVAVLGFGAAGGGLGFTPDHARARESLAQMVGQATVDVNFKVGLSEALAIAGHDLSAMDAASRRECAKECGLDRNSGGCQVCLLEIQSESDRIAIEARQHGESSVRSLRSLLGALGRIDAPKTLILISGGLGATDSSAIAALGGVAAFARTAIYIVRVDAAPVDLAELRPNPSAGADRDVRAATIDVVAAFTRGTVLRASGTGGAFKQIERELAGFYALGIEARPTDNDGKGHVVVVDVGRRGATVRASRLFSTPVRVAATPNDRLADAMASPFVTPAVRLRVATFAFPGAEAANRVRVLIHAEVGRQHAGPAAVPVRWAVMDTSGKVVRAGSADASLEPGGIGPSPLIFRANFEIEPGDYTLKMAVLDGDEVGSIEHPLRSTLSRFGAAGLSDLLIAAEGARGDTASVIGDVAQSLDIVSYVEVGRGGDPTSVAYELARSADGPALIRSESVANAVGAEATGFTGLLRTSLLQPGRYVVRARVTAGDRTATLVRSVNLSGAPVTTAAPGAEPARAPDVAARIAVPAGRGRVMVSRDNISRPFAPIQILGDPVRGALLDRLWPEGRPPDSLRAAAAAAREGRFDQIVVDDRLATQSAAAAVLRGLKQFHDGALEPAANSFRVAMRLDPSCYTAMALLAAAYAAGGRDGEAAGAWQTSLIGLDELSSVYGLLSDAFIRAGDITASLSVLQEAGERWPDDAAILRRLAMTTAYAGDGPGALAVLNRYLRVQQDDRDLLFAGVLWTYQLRQAGTAVEDGLVHARSYADRYTQLGGTETALVQEWLTFLERQP